MTEVNNQKKHIDSLIIEDNGKVNQEQMKKKQVNENDNKTNEKISVGSVVKLILKIIGLLGVLYFFICSLEIMSLSFRLIGGRYASEWFTSNVILTNPLAGLMIGIVVTVIVQSSSTSTSIVVTMVAAEILKVKQAVPIIMGANIGTSVTSTLVSLGHMSNTQEFRRAFAGGIVHDIFNFLSVLVLLPIEIAFGYLEAFSKVIVNGLLSDDVKVKEPEFLNAITKPLTSKIIQLDKTVLELIAKQNSTGNETLIKHFCSTKKYNQTIIINATNITVEKTEKVKCDFLLEPLNWPEWTIGLMLLIISLIVLCTCLIFMVKILSSLFQGRFANVLKKIINADFPGPAKYLTGYVAIFLGCIFTILIQSSSVFTSALIPLISVGVFELERVFPLVLGANIGTTVTGILAALSTSGRTVKLSLQIALCHTLFNVTGILIWYPIPFMRKVPIETAKYLGSVTEKYRWFAIFYLLVVFVVVPLFIFAISLAGWIVVGCVLAPIFVLLLFILIVNIIQNKKPSLLPKCLRNWEFLPIYLRSLEPYDKLLTKLICCRKFRKSNKVEPTENDDNNETNV